MSYRIAKAGSRQRVAAEQTTADTVRITLPARDYLFAQVSIVSSVSLEDKSTYLINPVTSKYVNSNGDAWSNEALKANFGSFIGAYNYINHIQEPEKAVGFLADAALRRIILNAEENLFIYYVDLLVATHRKSHPALSKQIVAGKVQYLSMGCESFMSTCSACGHQAEDETDFCEHLDYHKGKYFLDKSGTKRVTAELLGTEKPGSVHFQEASWLTEPPAFGGAVRRHLLPLDGDQQVVLSMPAQAAAKPAVKQFLERK